MRSRVCGWRARAAARGAERPAGSRRAGAPPGCARRATRSPGWCAPRRPTRRAARSRARLPRAGAARGAPGRGARARAGARGCPPARSRARTSAPTGVPPRGLRRASRTARPAAGSRAAPSRARGRRPRTSPAATRRGPDCSPASVVRSTSSSGRRPAGTAPGAASGCAAKNDTLAGGSVGRQPRDVLEPPDLERLHALAQHRFERRISSRLRCAGAATAAPRESSPCRASHGTMRAWLCARSCRCLSAVTRASISRACPRSRAAAAARARAARRRLATRPRRRPAPGR